MKKVIEKRGGSNCIDIVLEYDKERYNIELANAEEKIILRRLSDKKIIKIFDCNLGFIVQIDKEEETYFVVSSFSKKKHKCFLDHYIEDGDSLSLENKLECDSTHLEDLRLSDRSFLVGRHRDKYIYNLEKVSKSFDNVYNDDKIKKYFSDNTILVSRKVYSKSNSEITDTITYGVNPETFEGTTPIWSVLQRRSIPIYTEKQIDEIEERENEKGNNFPNRGKYNDSEITIYYEIEEPLYEIGMYFDKPEGIYRDYNQKVNEKLIRRLIKKENN